jgi:putative ABC transport system substrate-binding protein
MRARGAGLAARRLAAAALALGFAIGAAGPARAASSAAVVLLRSGDLDPYREAERGFRTAFPDSIVTLDASTRTPEDIASAVRALHPEVVVAIGLRAAVVARDRLARVPVVYCAIPHPKRFDLDGDWMVGVRNDVDPGLEVAALRQIVPNARSIGYLCSANADPEERRRARAAARAAGFEFVEAPIASAADLPVVARRLATQVQALWMPADPLVATPEGFRFLLGLSLSTRLPILAFTDALVKKGALVAVAPDYAEAGALAAQQVKRIRAGERPADLPSLSVSRMHTVVNLATAHSLGATGADQAARGMEVVR